MNAPEVVQAAIVRLEALRAMAFAGPWKAFHSGVANGDHSYVVADHESIAYISANDGIDEEYRGPTADLIATLHGTIDAQLEALRSALWLVSGPGASPVAHAHAATWSIIKLAEAIVGKPHD